jgi:ATP-dependent Clp protease ATP-binding subunit ClpX
VLTEVKGSLVQQYTALFGYSGVEIRFTNAALCEICRKAAERGGGARGLRGMMVNSQSASPISLSDSLKESLLLDPMYEVP